MWFKFQQDLRKQQAEEENKKPVQNVIDHPLDEDEEKQGNEQIVSTSGYTRYTLIGSGVSSVLSEFDGYW